MHSKTEILQEHYGVETTREVIPLLQKDFSVPPLPLSYWTTLELPYEAPSHPGIPSFDEIERAMKVSRLTKPGGLFHVCRVGMSVVKMSWDPMILQVSSFNFVSPSYMTNQE
jgi:hypothetical protein